MVLAFNHTTVGLEANKYLMDYMCSRPWPAEAFAIVKESFEGITLPMVSRAKIDEFAGEKFETFIIQKTAALRDEIELVKAIASLDLLAALYCYEDTDELEKFQAEILRFFL